jgi:hypothetical protein
MSVFIKIVKSKSDLKKFIFLPKKIHAQHENWLPPLYRDEWRFYNPKWNKELKNSDTILLLASKEEKIMGRIMGIIHKRQNELQNERTARFFNLDCYNDSEVSHALLSAIETWACEKGMTKIIGPFGFSDKDPQGLQTEGFEYLPVIATATNLPYLQSLVEHEGYQKEVDCIVYRLETPKQVPEIYRAVYERVIRNKKIRLLEFTNRKQLKPFIIPVLRMVNETYSSIYGFVPLDEEDMLKLAARYIPILDPVFTKLVVDENNVPLAFVVASPDISEGIKKANGKIFPFGFIHILLSAKRTKQLDLFLGAVKEQYRGSGIIALLGTALLKSVLKRGLEQIDSHLILETNKAMRNVMDQFGATVYKKYRIYKKYIS